MGFLFRILLLVVVLATTAVLGFRAWVDAPRITGLPYSFQLLDRQGRELRRLTSRDGYWRLPVDPAEVDTGFLGMLLAYEDQRFPHHPGVDVLALLRATGQWLGHGEAVSGASTLTMQVVRLLHPRPRSLGSKLMEILQAIRLETILEKRQILRLYLELAPYGGNLQGIRAASLAYFGKEPYRLSVSESALLIALPQSPEARRPDRHPGRARAARDHVLRQLHRRGLIDTVALRLARQQPVPEKRLATPFRAPHLADRLRLAYPDEQQIVTTLDGDLQSRLEQLAATWPELGKEQSLALLVVENATARVVGHLGSGDYLTQSQLDLTRALRSPGSTLKPFIYGLGFEQNGLHPETLVLDRPFRAGGYGPRNIDHNYRGMVSLRTALQQSLNIPAVKVLQRLGVQRLLQRFREVGMELRLPRGKPAGLAIALGGAGITLEELVAGYSAIARGGLYRPLRFRERESGRKAHRLLSAAAAWYLDDILKDTPAPQGYFRTRPIRYKTGTSYGDRDAWALGYTRDYTVGVWIGAPDGSAGVDRSGYDTAAPLLFRVFEMLPEPEAAPPLRRPDDVLLAANPDLPRNMRWLSGKGGPGSAQGPRILFPVQDSTVFVSRHHGQAGIVFKAEAGQPPFHWLINGELLSGGNGQRQMEWQPDGPGLHRLTLIDARGKLDRVRFRVGN